MLQPASAENLAEARSLPAADFPMTRRLLPAFEAQQPAETYALMVETVLNGIERLLASAPESSAGG